MSRLKELELLERLIASAPEPADIERPLDARTWLGRVRIELGGAGALEAGPMALIELQLALTLEGALGMDAGGRRVPFVARVQSARELIDKALGLLRAGVLRRRARVDRWLKLAEQCIRVAAAQNALAAQGSSPRAAWVRSMMDRMLALPECAESVSRLGFSLGADSAALFDRVFSDVFQV